jgi:hypothetical protein
MNGGQSGYWRPIQRERARRDRPKAISYVHCTSPVTVPSLEFLENHTFFSDLYLETRFRERFDGVREDSKRIWIVLRDLYATSRPERFGAGLEKRLREEFIDKVLDTLGWQRSSEGGIPGDGNPDYTLFVTPVDKENALNSPKDLRFFDHAAVLVEAKPWDNDLASRGGREVSARGQVYGYVEATHVRWGMATNGRQWMLICRDFPRAQQRDYIVDLEALLNEKEWTPQFNYFYLAFSQRAFAEDYVEQALRDSALSSETVGEDLKKNVFEALLLLGKALAQARPDLLGSTAGPQLIKENCLTFLYRLLFINYAESRRLVPMDQDDTYRRTFSLQRVKESIRSEAPAMATREYERIPADRSNYSRNIRRLFQVIDKGSVPARIPAYNGGLFDPGSHPLLEEQVFDDRTLAQVVDLVSRSSRDPDRFLDYSYLGVRELGSIYEGILEYDFELNDAQARSLRLRFSGGERKVTGSYYTPEPIVSYIVRATLGPLVDQVLAQTGQSTSEKVQAVLNLKVLDPAMGSGHFLVGAVEYLAGRLLDIVESDAAGVVTPDEESQLEEWAKREAAIHCVFGVDINPMAVELAKVSIWLTTFSRSRPLSFLDAHLQCGNSLVGSWIEEIPLFPSLTQRQPVLSRESRARVRPFDISGLLDELASRTREIQSLPEDTADQVESKRGRFSELRRSPFFDRLWTVASVRTAVQDLETDDRKTAERSWHSLVDAVTGTSDEEWSRILISGWIQHGLKLAAPRRPFHWELAFPDVFSGTNKGFAATIGNPPYVRIYRGSISPADRAYFQNHFKSAHMKFDLYLLFLEQSLRLLNRGGKLGLIVPDKFTTSPYGEPLRRLILRQTLESILDLRSVRVFEGVAVSNIIPVIAKRAGLDNEVRILKSESLVLESRNLKLTAQVPQSRFESSPQSQIRLDTDFSQSPLLSKLKDGSIPLSDACYVNWGLRTGTKERTQRLISEVERGQNPKRLLRGEDVRERYVLARPPRFIDYSPADLYNPLFPEFFESPKVIFRKISGPEGILAAADESGAYCFSTLICATNRGFVAKADWPGVPRPTKASRRFLDPYLILAICNSELISWWYRQTFSDNIGVNPNHVKAIPLPRSLLLSERSESPQVSGIDWAGIEIQANSSPIELERITSTGGRELQAIGDGIAGETLSFLGWLEREFGVKRTVTKGFAMIERFESVSGEGLLAVLKRNRGGLSQDPSIRAVQDRVLAEHARAVSSLRDLRSRYRGITTKIEKAIHRLFDLSGEESDVVLKANNRTGGESPGR